MAKITLLIAVYNAGKFLERCLDSLLVQTFTDFEAICADDASTDASPDILRRYAQRDSRIKYLRMPRNGGQAKARNAAMQLATGSVVTFLDSDDWLSPDALEECWNEFQHHPETDCVLFQCIFYMENTHERKPYVMPPFVTLSGRRAFMLSLDWTIHGIYAARADIQKRIPYDDSLPAFSDDNTTRLHYLASREVRQCSGLYFYRQHDNSVNHGRGSRRFYYVLANAQMSHKLEEMHIPYSLRQMYENHRWLNLVGMYYIFTQYRREHRLTPLERRFALLALHRAWQSIHPGMLLPGNHYKPGYLVFHGMWPLFRLQAELYGWLRWHIRHDKL